MKFLHTSDLHIGGKQHNIFVLDEQKLILDEIADICDKHSVDVVLVAGDLLDSRTRCTAAEKILFDGLLKIADGGNRLVLAVSGNRDNIEKLEACAGLLASNNIYIVTDPTQNIDGSCDFARIKITDSQNGFVKLSDGTQTAVVGLLPYPTETQLAQSGLDYQKLMYGWIQAAKSGFSKQSANILVGHMAVHTSPPLNDDVALNRVIDNELLSGADYVALGHAHRCQVVDHASNIVYSGSTSTLDFVDGKSAQKAGKVIYFEVPADKKADDENQLEIAKKVITLENSIKARKITAASLDAARTELDKYRDAYCVLNLSLMESLSVDERAKLNADFPKLVQINLSLPKSVSKTNKLNLQIDEEQMFKNFYKTRHLTEPSAELTKMFLSMLKEKQ